MVSRAGVTLLEVVVVMSILGVLLSIGAAFYPSQEARAYANDVRALLMQGRYESVKRNQPIAVVWDQDSRSFTTIVSTPDEGTERVFSRPCEVGRVTGVAASSDYRRLTVAIEIVALDDDDEEVLPVGPIGVLWLPNGQARGCDYDILPGETIATISDRSGVSTVTVSVAGRVVVR